LPSDSSIDGLEMVDFKKKLGLKSIEKKYVPVEIYDELDRRIGTESLCVQCKEKF
jgi:hypothetical protein